MEISEALKSGCRGFIQTGIERVSHFLIANTIKIRLFYQGPGKRSPPDHKRKVKQLVTLAVAKPSDYLDPQVSLDDNNLDDSTFNVPFVAGKLKQFASEWLVSFSKYLKLTIIPRK